MKKILLTTFISFSLLTLHAQEKAIAKIHYIFKHVNDTTQKDKHIRDEVATYLGKQASYYTSYSSTRMQEQTSKILSAPDFDGNLVISRSTSGIKESYLLEPSKSKMVEVKRVASDEFLLETTYPKQDWDIEDETKVIGGYTCQKATTTFAGRHYTAWFTTDIPFSFGPWKLHGLPGLILAVKDDKSEVEFEYSGFDKLTDDVQVKIGTPANAILSKKDEVEKLEQAFKANPSAYMQTRSSRRSTGAGVFVSISGASSSAPAMDASKIKSMTIKNDDDYKPSSVINNPLELKPY